MDASTVVAICATVIAVASLAVSVYQARATRRHNQLSVRPLLELLRCRLGVELRYQSVYGGQTWTATWTPRPDGPGCPERDG
jgi:hypothetical protein